MIATTIINSIRVKPPCPVLTYFCMPCFFMALPLAPFRRGLCLDTNRPVRVSCEVASQDV